MPQADFAYAPANDTAAMPLAVSIFADRADIRAEMGEEVAASGLSLRESDSLADLLEGEPRPLGEVVLLDCPTIDAAALAALTRLDMRAKRAGAHLVISTGVSALDDVFACCDQSAAQILVDPTRAERVIAIGRVLARIPNLRLRELSQGDRVALLRLTEQVAEIARRIETLGASPATVADDRTFRVESPATAFAGFPTDRRAWTTPAERLPAQPPLPDPRLVRRMIRQRQLRVRFFDGALFADPAWDILLDLTAARAERSQVSVTSLCIASGVPPTTALRWIGQMTEAGLLERIDDESDRRRAFIGLTEPTADAMAAYFAALAQTAAQPV
jgi:hypothetical protein